MQESCKVIASFCCLLFIIHCVQCLPNPDEQEEYDEAPIFSQFSDAARIQGPATALNFELTQGSSAQQGQGSQDTANNPSGASVPVQPLQVSFPQQSESYQQQASPVQQVQDQPTPTEAFQQSPAVNFREDLPVQLATQPQNPLGNPENTVQYAQAQVQQGQQAQVQVQQGQQAQAQLPTSTLELSNIPAQVQEQVQFQAVASGFERSSSPAQLGIASSDYQNPSPVVAEPKVQSVPDVPASNFVQPSIEPQLQFQLQPQVSPNNYEQPALPTSPQIQPAPEVPTSDYEQPSAPVFQARPQFQEIAETPSNFIPSSASVAQIENRYESQPQGSSPDYDTPSAPVQQPIIPQYQHQSVLSTNDEQPSISEPSDPAPAPRYYQSGGDSVPSFPPSSVPAPVPVSAPASIPAPVPAPAPVSVPVPASIPAPVPAPAPVSVPVPASAPRYYPSGADSLPSFLPSPVPVPVPALAPAQVQPQTQPSQQPLGLPAQVQGPNLPWFIQADREAGTQAPYQNAYNTPAPVVNQFQYSSQDAPRLPQQIMPQEFVRFMSNLFTLPSNNYNDDNNFGSQAPSFGSYGGSGLRRRPSSGYGRK